MVKKLKVINNVTSLQILTYHVNMVDIVQRLKELGHLDIVQRLKEATRVDI